MARAFWKEPFLEMAKYIWKLPTEHWIDDSPRIEDTNFLEKYATMNSQIDKVNFRAEMIAKWRQENSGVNLKVRELPGRTRVVFLGTDKQWSQIPWSFWARIFQAVEHPIGYTLIYAHPQKRVDPAETRELTAVDINGGFSYLARQEVVVLYRYEELTRVLLHELLHTLGFDMEKSEENLEAYTEAWTELFLCALLSRGQINKFNKLWTDQVNWMVEQSESLQIEYNVNTSVDYAWRYIKGKVELLENQGYLQGFINKNKQRPSISLRFTVPSWDAEMY
jgi:hypothetical protein